MKQKKERQYRRLPLLRICNPQQQRFFGFAIL